jgi:hypothetical protein
MNLQKESGMAVSSCRFLHICVQDGTAADDCGKNAKKY